MVPLNQVKLDEVDKLAEGDIPELETVDLEKIPKGEFRYTTIRLRFELIV